MPTAPSEPSVPEAGAPGVSVPEAGAPQAGAPKAGAPEVSVPEAGAPQAGTPGTGVPRAGGCGPGTSPVRLGPGQFTMGSDAFYPDERPAHRVGVGPFEIDPYPVTNAEFAAFVEETGYLTVAERVPDPTDFPEADPSLLVPGSLVFTGTSGPVNLSDWRQWWSWVPGASWRHPFGPSSSIVGLDDHPVVQVSFEDASSYARWAGARLPTEAEWEFAARGGADGLTFAWGDDERPGGRLMANVWQGRFPYESTRTDGWRSTTPVGSFPPNGFGLYDMIGNVWEWTASPYTDRHTVPDPSDRRTGDEEAVATRGGECGCGYGVPPLTAANRIRVLKGGSHLCAPEYCFRYRPAARSPQTEDSATTHIGFRCARSA